MKTIRKIALTALMAAVALAAATCKKESSDLSQIKVSGIEHSDCLNLPAKDITPVNDSVAISYEEGTIHVTHYKLMVNCGFEEVHVSTAVSGDTIRINEWGEPNNANCICHIINDFDIGNVPHGTYTLVFENWHSGPHFETVEL